MAGSVSLAVLENLVHMNRQDFPVGYAVVGATIPGTLEIVSLEELPTEYRRLSPLEVGNRWIDTQQSAILRVPSVVVPHEFNYLLNPRHPHFTEVVPEIPIPFSFDTRLFQRQGTCL